MSYEKTKGAAERLRQDARGNADEMRLSFSEFLGSLAERFNIVGDDARRFAQDGSRYAQDWLSLVRADLMREVKITATNAVTSLAAVFVAALGFLLLNMGVIWTLSATDTGVGPWFIIFGAAWIVLGLIAGAIAYGAQRKSMQSTSERVREDLEIPREHAQTVYQRIQEQRNGSSTAH